MSIYDGAEEDIQKLAEAVLEEFKDYDDGDYAPKGYYCKFCYRDSGKFNYDENNILHTLDCPVLIAKDLLTKMEEEK